MYTLNHSASVHSQRMVMYAELLMVSPDRTLVAIQVLFPAKVLVIWAILSCGMLLTLSPSGESHLTAGSGLELEESQLSSSVSPSLTVVTPLTTGGLKPADKSHERDSSNIGSVETYSHVLRMPDGWRCHSYIVQ